MGNELAVYSKVNDPLAFAEIMGTWMSKARAFGCESPEEGKILALTCLCENLHPIDFKRRYHMIGGNPTMRADAMLAEWRMANSERVHRVLESTPDVARLMLIDEHGADNEFSLTWEQAEKEKWPWRTNKEGKVVLSDNWATPIARSDMLWARVVSRAIRRIAPEIVAGVYTPEETMDFTHENGSVVESVVVESKMDDDKSAPSPLTLPDGSPAGSTAAEEVSPVSGGTPRKPKTFIGTTVVTETIRDGNVPDSPVDTSPAPPEHSLGEGFCSEGQVQRLCELIEQLRITEEQLSIILGKRKCEEIRGLQHAQALELIQKLEAKLGN